MEQIDGANVDPLSLSAWRVWIEIYIGRQQRLEEILDKHQKTVVESLVIYTENIVEHIDDKTEVLNKRGNKLETDIERLYRQQEA